MLVESKDKDLAMGAVQKMYELHKDSNQNIREKWLEFQFALLERQQREAENFTYMSCDKRLTKNDQRICSSRHVLIYCSKESVKRSIGSKDTRASAIAKQL